jgi:pantoate kinase
VTSRAFAPGHVSALFAVHDEAPDLLAKGSRGAGWSVDRGAHAAVERAAATHVLVDGAEAPAPVTRDALAGLAPGRPLRVELRLGLPVGQGFGMSAAGTLAACLAATHELGLDPDLALAAAHAAEVAAGTGLGDAVGSWVGAAEVRLRPGVPPVGQVLRVEPPGAWRFAFCVLGPGIATPGIIRDAAWKARTRALGDAVVDRVAAAGRALAWDQILREGNRFSRELGLMPPALAAAGAALPPGTPWGQSMLGNVLWAAVRGGEGQAAAAVRAALAGRGFLLECGLDPGARLVREGPPAAGARFPRPDHPA